MSKTNLKSISQKMRPKFQILNGHKLTIFHPISTLFLKMVVFWDESNGAKSLALSPLVKDLVFESHFYQGLTWTMLGTGTQNHPQFVGMCPGHQPQIISQNLCSKNIAYHTPSPLPLWTHSKKNELFVHKIFWKSLEFKLNAFTSLLCSHDIRE